MKKLVLLVLVLLPLSCFDTLNSMYEDLTMKVPICVNSSNGNDANDGRGWTRAKLTIQAAVNAAEPGDEIWVAGTHNLSLKITITKSNISIYGGFKATESRRDERDLGNKTQITYSSTDEQAIYFNSSLGINFNGFQIFSVDCEAGAISINNSNSIVISNSYFYNNIITTGNGGAINIASSSVKILNSEFTDNSAPGGGENGGAIYVYGNSNIEISGCSFNNNSTSGMGGAIYSDSSGATITLFNSTFKRNTATNDGGACNFTNVNSLIISGCTFGVEGLSAYRNRGDQGGALYLANTTTQIINSYFYNNEASFGGQAGGAIFLTGGNLTINNCTIANNIASGSPGYGGGICAASTLTITNSIISGNEGTQNGAVGGGLYLTGSGLKIIINCTITGNKCNNTSGYAGAIYLYSTNCEISGSTLIDNKANMSGGAIFAEAIALTKTLTISNTLFKNNSVTNNGGAAISINNGPVKLDVLSCHFEGNTASNTTNGWGGAIRFLSSDTSSRIINSLFYNNNAGVYGGGLYIATPSTTSLVNLTFYSNHAVTSGGAIYASNSPASTYTIYNTVFYANSATSGYNIQSARPVNRYNCFYNLGVSDTGGIEDPSCIINNPNSPFVSTEPGDGRFLRPNSYIIDKGLNNIPGYTRPTPDLDIGGFPRIANGIVDIGVYEWQ